MSVVFKQNLKNFYAIAHKKICSYATERNAFTNTNLLVVVIRDRPGPLVISKPTNFTDAACQNLTFLKFSLRFLCENLSITSLKLMLRSR